METQQAGAVEYGAASLTMPGEEKSGDGHLLRPFQQGLLAAVVDGLGHGPEAATAAHLAIEALQEQPEDPVSALIERCHQRLRFTRGAVMSLASFNSNSGTITWAGIGNVTGVLWRDEAGEHKKFFLILGAGVIGYQLPQLYPCAVAVKTGDVLALATDGIRSEFAEEVEWRDPPQRLAERILAEYSRKTDDAEILVLRFVKVESRHEVEPTGCSAGIYRRPGEVPSAGERSRTSRCLPAWTPCPS